MSEANKTMLIIRAAIGAGGFGAMLVGAGEAIHLWRAVGINFTDGMGTLLYSMGIHGLFGIAGGLLLGLAFLLTGMNRRFPSFSLHYFAGTVCGIAVLTGGLIIGTFRIQRDTDMSGISAVLAALIIAVLLSVISVLFVISTVKRSGGLIGETNLTFSLIAFFAGCAILAPKIDVPVSVAASDDRPNVILIVVDTLRADATGPYGAVHTGGKSITPNLDRFASEGMVFERMYANSTWTRPSMASLFTGRIPSGHGAIRQEDPLHHELPHLAKSFRDAGYATAAGVTNVNLSPEFGFDAGFDVYRYHGPSRPLWARGPAVRLSLINVSRLVYERITSRLSPERFYAEAAVINNEALDLVDGLRDGGPFFLWAHYMDPHDPFFRRPYDGYGIARVRTPNPPPEWADEMRQLYLDDIGWWDLHFGKLLESLNERGLMDNTIVLLTSDHGEEFQEHGGWWHGETSFEELSRVPLIIRLPGGINAGSRDGRLASIIDVAPTLLSAAGIEVPEGMSGIDLLGAQDDGSQRVVVMEEDHGGMVMSSIVWDRYKLMRTRPDNPRGFPEIQLFDLVDDPGEQNNIEDDPEMVKMLLELLERRLAGEPAAPPPSERRKVDMDSALEEDLRSLGYIQ